MNPARKAVNIEYRRNMEAYRQWEEQVRSDHEEAIRNLKKREKVHVPVFHMPAWVVTLAALAFFGALVFVFRKVFLHDS